MAEWLLTIEERRQVWFEFEKHGGFRPYLESYDEVEDEHAKWQCRAQLRKVVEKIAGHHLLKAWEWAELRHEAGL